MIKFILTLARSVSEGFPRLRFGLMCHVNE